MCRLQIDFYCEILEMQKVPEKEKNLDLLFNCFLIFFIKMQFRFLVYLAFFYGIQFLLHSVKKNSAIRKSIP
jgi:hypothetical protein